jgi:hypothetical protein
VTRIADNVVESLRAQPFVLVLFLINVLTLIGFAITLREVSEGIERKDALLESCIERSRR